MMRQYARRFLRVDIFRTSRLEVPDQTPQRGFFPDKPTIPGPRDQIDMHVGSNDTRSWANPSPRANTRYSAEPAIDQERQEIAIKPVPWRRQHGESTSFEKRCQSYSATSQIARHRLTRTLRRKLALFAVDGVALVAPTVLKDKETRCLARPKGMCKPCGEPRVSIGGNNRERDRNFATDRKEPIEPIARHCGIIVAPPQSRDPSGLGPAVELVGQIRPSHCRRQIFASQLTDPPIIMPGGRNIKPADVG